MARRAPKPVDDPNDAGAARREALKVLKARLISRATLISRLARRGYSKGVAERTAADLEGLGLLNDPRLAESLARKQMNTKPVGKRVLVAKIRQRGIPAATANEAAEARLKDRDVLADALDLARRKVRILKPGEDPQVVARKLFAYLARRGFDADVCRAAVERVIGNLGDLDEF